MGPRRELGSVALRMGLDVQAEKTNTSVTETIVEASPGHRTNMTVLVQDHFYCDARQGKSVLEALPPRLMSFSCLA